MGIKSCFWASLLVLLCFAQLSGQSLLTLRLEERVEQWRDLLRQGERPAVLDSCDALLAAWPPSEGPRLKALVITLKANALRQMGDPEKSLALHQDALRLRRSRYGENHPELAGSLQNIGNCLLDLGRADEALPVLKKAAALKERFFKHDPSRLLSTYTSLGQCCTDLGEYPEAGRYLGAALDIETRIGGPNSPDLAARLLALAELQMARMRPDSAASLLRRAQRLPLDTASAHHETYILILNNLGNACAALGRPAEAIAWLQRSLLRCDDRPGQSGMLRGRCLLNLGNCQFDLGDFEAAEISLRAARACLSEPADQAAALNSFSLVMRYRDRSAEAVDSFLAAYNLYLRAVPSNANRRAAAGVCMNLGSAYLDQARLTEALFYFQKALDLYLDLPRMPQTAHDLAACYDKMGQVHFRGNDPSAAQQNWNLAASLAPGGPPGLLFAIWLHQGEWQTGQQQWDAALAAYQKAQAAIQPSGPRLVLSHPYELAQVKAAIAQLWLARSRQSQQAADWEKTLAAARESITALGALKAHLRTDRSAIEMQEAFDAPFDVAVAAAVALGQPEVAWQFSEAFKINFLHQLSWRSAEQSGIGLPPALMTSERSRAQRLAYFQQRRNTQPEAALPALDDSIRVLTEAGYQFRMTLARQYPVQFKALYSPDLPDAAAVRRHLRPDQSLLAYHWGKEQAWAFVISADTLAVVSLDFPQTAGVLVWRFFQHCSTNPYGVPDDLRKRVFAEICADGAVLYRRLVAPLEPLLKPSVLIVPDGLLCLLPFEALVTSADTASPHRFHRHHFFLEKHHVGYAHSAAAWLNLRQAPRSKARFPLLAVAPSFDQNPQGLKPLRHNAAEADSVRVLTGGQVWKDQDALLTRFVAEAGQYRVLLLSTHGVTNDREPLASFVAFTALPAEASAKEGQTSNSELHPEASGSNSDGLLRVSDLYGMRLPADLVVLSACQTASGQLYRGEGILSVARGFQFAGAKSLVASLWNVDDRNTPALMRSFFGFLWKKHDKPAALTEAKRAYLRRHQGLDAHPYYWAGLVGIGDDAPLMGLPENTGWALWLGWAAAIVLVLGAVAVMAVRYRTK